MRHFSWNINLTMEIVDEYPDKDWDWHMISKNKNITFKMIEKYPNKPWDWSKIGKFYLFEKDKEMEIKKLKFKQIEEELIQKTWHPSRFQDWCLNDYEKEKEE